jgi:hypothetical protein
MNARAKRRSLATILVGFWLVGTLGLSLHLLVDSHVHRYCVEHRVLEEVATRAGATPTNRNQPAARDALDVASRATAPGAHIPCPFFNWSQRDRFNTPRVEGLPRPSGAHAWVPPYESTTRSSAMALMFAPKTSPPPLGIS